MVGFDELGLLRSDFFLVPVSEFFFIRYGEYVVLVTLTAIFWQIIVDIECEINEHPVSVSFSNGVTVPIVLPSDG